MSFVNDLKNTVTSSRAAIAAAQEEAAAFERKRKFLQLTKRSKPPLMISASRLRSATS